jgi:hemoglobin-like flavoprotein
MENLALIMESLEFLAESEEDIYGKVYEYFYQENAEAEALMSHMDELTKGKMLEEVTRLLLSEDLTEESTYLDFELNTHTYSYSVALPMYQQLFASFAAAIKEVIGNNWRPDMDDAWQARIAELTRTMEAHAPAQA